MREIMKVILLTVLCLLLIPGQLLFAETGADKGPAAYDEVEMVSVIEEIADLKDENIILIDKPQTEVTVEIDTELEFSEILEELLADSDYRFVKSDNYYLIGRFSTESAEFARQSQTLFYKTKYRRAEILAGKLDYPRLRIRVLEGRDKIMIQGLPADVERAEEELKELDREDRITQVQYQLTVVDISEERFNKINLEQLALSSETEDNFSFNRAGDTIEAALTGIINNIALNAETSIEKSLNVVNPSLVTEIGTTGSLNISEEILGQEAGETSIEETSFTAEFTPRQVSTKGEILTDIEFNAEGSSLFATTTRLKPEETELIGLLQMNTDKLQEKLAGKREVNEERFYAVFISAAPSGSSPAAELAGLDQIVFPDHLPTHRFKPAYIQYLFDANSEPDIDFYLQDRKTDNVVRLSTRDGSSYLQLGLGLPVADGLTVDNRVIAEDDKGLRLLIGVEDNVDITDSFKLRAGYYPLVYSLTEDSFKEQAGYAEFDYKPRSFFMNLRYSHNIEQDPVRLQTGFKIKSSPYLMTAVSGDIDEINRLLTGIRFEF